MDVSNGHEQDLTVNLPDLSVLHIQTAVAPYSSNFGSIFLTYLPNTAEQNAHTAKEMLLAKSARLSLLALGSRFKPSSLPIPELQIFRRCPAFAPVELRRIRDVEPDSDLLEFEFDRDIDVDIYEGYDCPACIKKWNPRRC